VEAEGHALAVEDADELAFVADNLAFEELLADQAGLDPRPTFDNVFVLDVGVLPLLELVALTQVHLVQRALDVLVE